MAANQTLLKNLTTGIGDMSGSGELTFQQLVNLSSSHLTTLPRSHVKELPIVEPSRHPHAQPDERCDDPDCWLCEIPEELRLKLKLMDCVIAYKPGERVLIVLGPRGGRDGHRFWSHVRPVPFDQLEAWLSDVADSRVKK